MKTLFVITGLVALGLTLAFIFAPRGEIVTSVDIEASPERVWSVLTDGSRYHEWSPFIVALEGPLTEGGRITNRVRTADGREMTFHPTLLRVTPDRELRWLGHLIVPRLFDAEHYFVLQPVPGGTRLIHGEKFRGIALWFMDYRQFQGDLEQMNEALKRRAERLSGDVS